MKPRRLRLLPLAVLLCALFSCSAKLDKEEAADIIKKHYDFPNVEFIRIKDRVDGSHLAKGRFGSLVIGEESDLFRYAYNSFDYNHYGTLSDKGHRYEVPEAACDACIEKLPDYAKRWNYYCVATNVWEFREVTGISTDEAGETATVEYVVTAKSVNTFGSYQGKREGMEEKRKATLKRYDDGSWRVEDPKPPRTVKPDEVPFYAKKSNR